MIWSRRLWIAATIALGALGAWTGRHFMNPDGISYLDLSDHILAGRWSEAIDPYWSVGYPAMIAALRALTSQSRWIETPLIHLLNFALLLAAVGAFIVFLRAVRDDRPSTPASALFEACSWAAFLWGTLQLIKVRTVTPDLAVCAVVLLMGASILRVREHPRQSVLLGLLAGAGYVLKAAMLPAGAIAIALAIICSRRRTAVAAGSIIPFAVISLLVIVPLSAKSGRWTTGESGRLNYAWYVSGVTPHVHWQGDPRHGAPAHPPRLLRRSPDVYAFGEVFPRSTYAPWGHPEFFHRGIRIPIDGAALMRSIPARAGEWWEDLGAASLALLGIALLALRGRGSRSWKSVAPLILFSGLMLAMYSLVHVEGRLVAPFLIVLIVSVLAAVERWDRTATILTVVIAAVFVAVVLHSLVSELLFPRPLAARNIAVAQALSRAGIRPGSSVASLGDGFNAGWARLAGVRIVAEVPSRDVWDFRQLPSSEQRDIRCRLAREGAVAIVGPDIEPLSPCGGSSR